MFATYASLRRQQFLLGGLFLLLPAIAAAQFDFPDTFGGPNKFGGNRDAEVTVTAEFTPAEGDRPALVFVTAKIADGFHLYAVDQGGLPDGGGGPLATSISLNSNNQVRLTGNWQPVAPPETHVDQEIWTGLELREHTGTVTWFAPVEIAAGADPASLAIAGKISGQACNPQICTPFDQEFQAREGTGVPLPPGTTFTTVGSTAPVAPTEPVMSDPVQLAPPVAPIEMPTSSAVYDLTRLNIETEQGGSLSYYLLLAFAGGLILNIMPCVLPVIGLKVMSFVQQAGQSRAQALILNCWYAAGIIVVFLILAGLAVTLQLGWGGQFGSAGFNITLIAIVYAMALSLLGLWEIPIPGFVGAGAAINYAEREGPTAAFLKGVLTTVLATPCTGPFMASALAWAVKQPTWITFSVFGVLGLGMASPYLVIGAFPGLVKFLPKPGMWMETFKKIMGLVLLCTVVWLLTFIEPPLVVPTIALMVGIAAGCWWISQADITAPFPQKVKVWVVASLLIVLSAFISYGGLYARVMRPRYEEALAEFAQQSVSKERMKIAQELSQLTTLVEKDAFTQSLIANAEDEGDQPWQSFSLAKLQRKVVEEGRTVLVDFTADWCLTCKTYEKIALKTKDVENAINAAGVVTMEADYTHRPPAIEQTIKALKSNGVPVIAIFPASDPYKPIVFRGQYSEQAILDALAKATGGSGAKATGENTALSQTPAAEPRM
ncbi:MAG: thioredoxin family protein [Bythopirellula sp.]|nr:thioredoxin family protein [Bythopirellula sp.]